MIKSINDIRSACFVILSSNEKQGNCKRNELDINLEKISILRGYYPPGVDPFSKQLLSLGGWALAISSELPHSSNKSIMTFSDSIDDWYLLEDGSEPDIFFITCYTSMLANCLKCLVDLKNTFPNAIFVVGGSHPTYSPESFIGSSADLILIGEMDNQLEIIVQKAIQNRNGNKDLFFMGDYICHPIQLPDMDLYYAYSDQVDRIMPRILLSRDCLHNCAFCTPRGLRSGIKARRTDLNSFKSWVTKYRNLLCEDSLHIRFSDPDFLWDESWTKEVFKVLERLEISWDCQTRIPSSPEKLIRILPYMRRIGCRSIFFGIESRNQEVLNKIHKAYPSKNIEDVLYACSQEDVMTLCNLIAGLPYQSEASSLEDIDWACRSMIDGILGCVDLQFLQIMPGTRFFNNPDIYGITLSSRFDWKQIEQKVQHSTDLLSKERIDEIFVEGVRRLNSTYEMILSKEIF